MSDWNDVRPRSERAAVAHFATLRPDALPYSVPAWAGVEDDRLAVFMEKGTGASLQRDPRIAVTCRHARDHSGE